MHQTEPTLLITPRLMDAISAPAPDPRYIAALLRLAEAERTDLLEALEAIADMRVDEETDSAQLAALCIGIARAAIANATA